MLEFSIEKVCKARGIEKPYKFLIKNGFLPATATKLSKGQVEYLRLEYIERICTVLNCSPNDLFEWSPASKSDEREDHPLFSIRKSEKIDLVETIKTLPMNKLKEIESLISSIK
jgi:DNA-binding Xre family transcriptional regulator